MQMFASLQQLDILKCTLNELKYRSKRIQEHQKFTRIYTIKNLYYELVSAAHLHVLVLTEVHGAS